MTVEEKRARKAEYMRRWRARNPERVKTIAAACSQRNRAQIAARMKIYRQKNKAKLYEQKKAYSARNREKLRQWKRTDYERHRESYIARAHTRWREKNEQCRAYYVKRYRENKAVILARNRAWAKRNREKFLAWRRSYFKSPRGRAVRLASDRRRVKRATAYKNAWARRNREKITRYFRARLETDMSFAMRVRLRARITVALRKYPKEQRDRLPKSVRKLLGCTASELVKYLESKFLPGMSWENRKLWHMDHIRPLASFDLSDVEQQHVAFHYTNVQPLWAIDNFRKGARVRDQIISTEPSEWD